MTAMCTAPSPSLFVKRTSGCSSTEPNGLRRRCTSYLLPSCTAVKKSLLTVFLLFQKVVHGSFRFLMLEIMRKRFLASTSM